MDEMFDELYYNLLKCKIALRVDGKKVFVRSEGHWIRACHMSVDAYNFLLQYAVERGR